MNRPRFWWLKKEKKKERETSASLSPPRSPFTFTDLPIGARTIYRSKRRIVSSWCLRDEQRIERRQLPDGRSVGKQLWYGAEEKGESEEIGGQLGAGRKQMRNIIKSYESWVGAEIAENHGLFAGTVRKKKKKKRLSIIKRGVGNPNASTQNSCTAYEGACTISWRYTHWLSASSSYWQLRHANRSRRLALSSRG